MTFHEAFSFVFEGFKPKNRHQLSVLFDYTIMEHQGLGYLEKEVMQRFYIRMFLPVLTFEDEVIENSAVQRKEFLSFHYSKNKGRQLEFLSLLKFAMDIFNIDDNEQENTTKAEGTIITQTDVDSAKQDVFAFIKEKITILKEKNIYDLTDDNPELANTGQVQLAMYYYYRQEAGSIPRFTHQKGGLEAQARSIYENYGLSAQNFKNIFSKVNNPKTGKAFRTRKSQLNNLEHVINLLRTDKTAQEIACKEFEDVRVKND